MKPKQQRDLAIIVIILLLLLFLYNKKKSGMGLTFLGITIFPPSSFSGGVIYDADGDGLLNDVNGGNGSVPVDTGCDMLMTCYTGCPNPVGSVHDACAQTCADLGLLDFPPSCASPNSGEGGVVTIDGGNDVPVVTETNDTLGEITSIELNCFVGCEPATYLVDIGAGNTNVVTCEMLGTTDAGGLITSAPAISCGSVEIVDTDLEVIETVDTGSGTLVDTPQNIYCCNGSGIVGLNAAAYSTCADAGMTDVINNRC
jgi:hypothetical protein